jgi:23S rRNA (cytosine1962-C5)-methyltransferase
MMVPRIYLVNGVQKKIAEGHPWIYRNQIGKTSWPDETKPEPGDLVDVYDFMQRYLGTGIYNPASMLTVRLLTRKREIIDEFFIIKKVRAAVAYRQFFRRSDTDSYRIIFGESDLLPGVIADQFADTVILQILALGMEKWLPAIAGTLMDELHPANLILQHEEPVRQKEGLPLYRGVYAGKDPGRLVIRENGLRMMINLAGGQKTGGYLDQKANHAALRKFTKGKNVLDCFCYVGGFALNAAAGGAASVTGVDQSEAAIVLARENAGFNNFTDIMTWTVANAFDFLRDAVQKQTRYDVIILDPPAFAKSHAARQAALRGYKEINLSAFRLLEEGGILVTHSCSFHIPEDLFIQTVFEAAHDAKRVVRVMDVRRQDADHPVLAGYPESHYLKSLWLQVLE